MRRRRTTLPLALPLSPEAFSRLSDSLPLAISVYFDMVGEDLDGIWSFGCEFALILEVTMAKQEKREKYSDED